MVTSSDGKIGELIEAPMVGEAERPGLSLPLRSLAVVEDRK